MAVKQRLIFSGLIALGVVVLTWVVHGESSPFAEYFPSSGGLRNVWMLFNVLPFIASAMLSGSHGGGPDALFVIMQFVQWFAIAFIVLTLFGFFNKRSN
jgi:hypothetical protein